VVVVVAAVVAMATLSTLLLAQSCSFEQRPQKKKARHGPFSLALHEQLKKQRTRD